MEDDDPPAFDYLADTGFPLAEREPEPAAEPETFADEAPLDQSSSDIADSADPFAAEPPPSARFWHTDELEVRTGPAIEVARSRPASRSPGYVTISMILLLIAAGGAYAFVQIGRDPIVTLDGGLAVASTGALTSPAPETAPPETAALDPAARAASGIQALETGAAIAEAAEAPTPLVADRGDAVTEGGPPAITTETVTPAGDPVVATETTTPPAADPATTAPAPEAAAATGTPTETAAPLVAEDAGTGEGGPLVPITDPASAGTTVDPAAAPTAGTVAGATTGTTTTWVNMHTGPDNATPVVAVVPAGTALQVFACDPWCEVEYDGTRGYIWRDFVTPLPQ